MKLFDCYSWATGSMSEFTKPFKDNEALYEKAKLFWKGIENDSFIYLIIAFVLGCLLAIIYYKDFNNKPGRHYHPKYWGVFGVITLVLSFVITWLVEYLMFKPELKDSAMLEFNIASVNVLYAAIIYLATSIIYCNSHFSTNAYKLFKF